MKKIGQKKTTLKEALELPQHPLLPIYGYIVDKHGDVKKIILDYNPTQWARVRKKLEALNKTTSQQ